MVDGYYSIGETSRLTGLSVKAIRYYANEGVVHPSAISDAGYRLYAPDDIWRLVLVRLLREMEFGLPLIRNILSQSPDIPSIVRWQKDILDLQIKHLVAVKSRLEQLPVDHLGETSLAHLHTILEAMSMSHEEKQQWLADRWSKAMIPDGVSEDWKSAFLQQIKDSLPTQWSADQTQAWTELQALLDDPEYRAGMQESVRPFWQMLKQQVMEPDEWNSAMGKLMERAIAANQAKLSVENLEVQSIVDEWIALFSKALQLPVNETFMKRFSYYAQSASLEPNRRLWDIMVRLNHEKMEAPFHAQELMLAGLQWRLAQPE